MTQQANVSSCHVCHSADEPRNLVKITTAVGAIADAHPACIERHNKAAEETLRALEAAFKADEVLDHDINPDDFYAIETFLRRENPKVGKRFVDAVSAAAVEKRDQSCMESVFENIERRIAAGPSKIEEAFIAETAADLVDILYRLADDPTWHRDSAIETQAARSTALLLIKQTAWRHFEAALTESFPEFEGSNDHV